MYQHSALMTETVASCESSGARPVSPAIFKFEKCAGAAHLDGKSFLSAKSMPRMQSRGGDNAVLTLEIYFLMEISSTGVRI